MTNRGLDVENGIRFRKFCHDRGYTAAKVAEITGLSKSTIFQYFRGARTPTRFTQRMMSETLDYDMKQIFKD